MKYMHVNVFQDDDIKDCHEIIKLQETVEHLKADKVCMILIKPMHVKAGICLVS